MKGSRQRSCTASSGTRAASRALWFPDELHLQFVPLRGKVEDFVKRDQLPASIDMFLHDSSYRHRHMLWEFREFWGRLRDRGLLVSHDVHLNAAFPEFVAKTYAHDKKAGRLHAQRASHYEWGPWGYIGFFIKKEKADCTGIIRTQCRLGILKGPTQMRSAAAASNRHLALQAGA